MPKPKNFDQNDPRLNLADPGFDIAYFLEYLASQEGISDGLHIEDLARMMGGGGRNIPVFSATSPTDGMRQVREWMQEEEKKRFRERLERVWDMYMTGRRECRCGDPNCQTTILLQVFRFAVSTGK